MLQVSFNVQDGATSIRVSVRVANLQRAESLVKSRHAPDEVKMIFPIEPESFFVNDDDVPELVVPELSKNQAA
ncbi:MAG: hypothetical protein WA982_14510 [Rubrobacteraceae bacterium]